MLQTKEITLKKQDSKRYKMIKRIIVGPPLTIVGFAIMIYVAGTTGAPGEIQISILGLIPFLIGLGLGSLGLYILTLPIIRKYYA